MILDLVEGPAPDRVAAADADVRVNEVVNTALAAAAGEIQKRRITVTNAIPDSLPALRVDTAKFSRFFSFILRNELANVPDGATVRFEAKATDGASPELEVLVTDNGPGLPHEPILSIFDPFFPPNAAAEEFGAHLLACYFIAYHHGGTLTLQPIRSGGLHWKLTLPLKPDPAAVNGQVEQFIISAMTNERLWERLVGGG
jgi:K+-sensing histidine kinase KdpD